LTAYQIAFDTYESATQEFLQKLMRSISGNQDDSAMETDGQPASVRSQQFVPQLEQNRYFIPIYRI
jgi:hypothetical protein